MDLKKHGGAAASVPGVNGPSQSWAFICRKHKQMALFFQSREGRKPEQTGWVCVCTRTWKEERRRGAERESREREIKAGGMFLNLCVGGGASPTQNALPHSLQPTQVFRSITFLCSQQIMILPLHQSSPAILRESWNGDLMWSHLLICDA